MVKGINMDGYGEIIVVDDTITNLRLMSEMLIDEGYHVRASQDPQLALESALASPPDLILLDVKMPNMNGFELCELLKDDERTKGVPVIFVSALQDTRDRVRSFEVGGVDFIGKPIQREEVLARVSSQLNLLRMRRNLEERSRELSRANEKLLELDRLKSMFIASMSHELRTPLNSIIGFSGMMLQEVSGELNEEQKDNIGRIYRSGKHLLELISDVIDIAKIEAERIDIHVEEVSLKEVIDGAVATIKPLADKKQLPVTVEASNWPTIVIDRKRLFQCLLNYLSNAVKFTEQGNIVVSVRELNGDVEIAVQDTGIGIAAEDIPKLFGPFERLESHLQIKSGGTGLGLYLTKKIATEILQGSVAVESQIDKGSTFFMQVPKQLVDNDADSKEVTL